MRFLPALFLLATAAAPVPSFDLPQLKRDTETQSSDAFEGGAPETPGAEKTLAHLSGRVLAMGLKPGKDGQRLQPVPMVAITIDSSAAIDAISRDVAVATRQPQARVTLAASDLVFVGHGIVARQRGWNDYAGLDARGRTVLVLALDADIGRSLANSTAWPNWLPGSQFRTIRDKSRAGAAE